MDLTDTKDKEFSQLASLVDEQIDLAHGALLIAKAAYPDLNESLYLKRLDQMAARIKRDVTADSEPEDIMHLAKFSSIRLTGEKSAPSMSAFKSFVILNKN